MSTVATDPLHHAADYRVRFDEAGPDGLLRTSGLLRYAQDVAWRHSEERGFDRAWYRDRGLAWVVRAAELEMRSPVSMGATVEVTTEVAGYQRIWARRRAECRLPGQDLAAWIQTDWVLIDDRGRLARVPPLIAERFPAPVLDEPLLRVPLGEAPADAVRHRIRVRPHELDPMNHVNNAVYVDWLEETLIAGGPDGSGATTTFPRRIRIEYAAAAEPSSEVETTAWRTDTGWACRISAADGAVLVRATLEA
jgi:acyl-CoA thioesterase FadM